MSYKGYQGLAMQQYAPIHARRELSPNEEGEVEREQGKWLRAPFASDSAPISRKMADPLKRALIASLFFAVPGGVAGALAGKKLGGGLGAMAAAGSAGAAATGGLGGLLTYMVNDRTNEDLKEMMRRLPEGARIRDMKSDPVYQKERDRATQMAAARLQGAQSAALRGVMRSLI